MTGVPAAPLDEAEAEPRVPRFNLVCHGWLDSWMFGVALLSVKHGLSWAACLQPLATPPFANLPERNWRSCCASCVCAFRIRRFARLVKSARATTPMLVGWFRPVIILPTAIISGLSQEQLEAILAHELAHLRRGDALVLWFQRLMETLYFFHPGVRWISRRLQIECEHRCDDLAVAEGTSRETLAAALGRLALWNEPAVADFTLAATGHRPVLDRMRRLLEPPMPSRYRSSWPFATLSTMAVVTALAWFAVGWSHPLHADPPPAKSEASRYAASVRFAIQWLSNNNGSVLDPDARAEYRATQIEILECGELRRRALERVRGLHPELKEMAVGIRAERVKESAIIEVTCEAEDPKYAKVYVDALADEYMAFRQEMVEKSVGTAMNKVIEDVLSREKEVKKKAEARDDFLRHTPAEKRQTDEYKITLGILESDYKRTNEDYQEWMKTLNKLETALKLQAETVSIIERPAEARKRGSEARDGSAIPPANHFGLRHVPPPPCAG